MANKNKRLSINAMERAIAENAADETVALDWHGEAVTVKRRLGLTEMLTFVDGVVKCCFVGERSVYTPEARDFAIRCALLEHYAAFTLPANIEKRYALVYACDAVDAILKIIDRVQFDGMLRAIDEKIDCLVQTNIETVKRDMEELYASVKTLERRLSDLLKTLDADAINKLADAAANGVVDEAKLAGAVLTLQRKENAAE